MKYETLYTNPHSAAFFGTDVGAIITAAAEYLLVQLCETRLRYYDEQNEELVLWLRCTSLRELSTKNAWFLEVSTLGASELDVIAGNPRELLECNHEQRIGYISDMIRGSVEAYDDLLLR